MADLLKALDAAALNLERVRSKAEARVCDAAHAYVVAEVLAYSKAHPRRKVSFCSAMGTVTLHVQKGGALGRQTRELHSAYQFGGMYGDSNPPAFMGALERLADETELGYAMTGPLNLECRGGEIISQKTDW